MERALAKSRDRQAGRLPQKRRIRLMIVDDSMIARAVLSRIIESDDTFEIAFQNENLTARRAGRLVAIVPDLICVVDHETAEPITTEGLRYGQRVRVLGISTPAMMRTPEALAAFGPSAFGLTEEFAPVEAMVAS